MQELRLLVLELMLPNSNFKAYSCACSDYKTKLLGQRTYWPEIKLFWFSQNWLHTQRAYMQDDLNYVY